MWENADEDNDDDEQTANELIQQQQNVMQKTQTCFPTKIFSEMCCLNSYHRTTYAFVENNFILMCTAHVPQF